MSVVISGGMNASSITSKGVELRLSLDRVRNAILASSISFSLVFVCGILKTPSSDQFVGTGVSHFIVSQLIFGVEGADNVVSVSLSTELSRSSSL